MHIENKNKKELKYQNTIYIYIYICIFLTKTLIIATSSVHKENVVNNIPKTVGMRLRRLCSDRVEGDRIFADALDEYRAYMEGRGYDPMNIRRHFAEIANLKRQDALKKVEKRNGRKDQYFLLNSKNLLFQV